MIEPEATEPQKRKWITFHKSQIGITYWAELWNRMAIYFGVSSRWGFELTYDPWENSFDLLLVHWYVGVSFYEVEEDK